MKTTCRIHRGSMLVAALALSGCAASSRPAPVEHAFATPAEQGNPMAQFALGVRILARAHTPRERAPGIAWIERAARENLAIAQDRLGVMYLTGHDLPQDTSRALIWLHRAAARGAPAAELQLGQLYAVGSFLPVDKPKAYYWYSIAAKPVRSDVTIFNIVQVRFYAYTRAQALASSLTPAEKAAVDRQVAAWAPIPSVAYSGSVPIGRMLR
jgi:hypothetical protein